MDVADHNLENTKCSGKECCSAEGWCGGGSIGTNSQWCTAGVGMLKGAYAGMPIKTDAGTLFWK